MGLRLPALMRLLPIALLCATAAFAAEWTVETLPVKHRFAAEVAETVRLALTPEGQLTVHEGTNQLVIRDTPAAIRAAKSLLAQLDTPPRTVALSLTSTTREALEQRSAEIRWAVDSGGVRLGAILRAENGARVGATRQSLYVLSGKQGRLFRGSTRPVARSTGRYSSEVTYQTAGEDLYVRPVALPDGTVRVELSASSTQVVEGSGGVVEGSAVSTILVVADGDSVVVGEVERSGSGWATRWLSGRSTSATQESAVYLLHVSIKKENP